MTILSLYIPVISSNTTVDFVKKIFNTKKIGKVERVDFVKNVVKNRYEAFIHFQEWFNTDEANTLQDDIVNPDTKTRFVYSNTNKFWPLLVNKNPHKRINNPTYKIVSSNDMKLKCFIQLL